MELHSEFYHKQLNFKFQALQHLFLIMKKTTTKVKVLSVTWGQWIDQSGNRFSRLSNSYLKSPLAMHWHTSLLCSLEVLVLCCHRQKLQGICVALRTEWIIIREACNTQQFGLHQKKGYIVHVCVCRLHANRILPQ